MRSFKNSGVKIHTKIFKHKKAAIVIAATIAIIIIFNIFNGNDGGSKTLSSSVDKSLQSPSVKASQKINQTFNFSIDNNNIGYTIETAELQDEIIIKGQVAKSVKGKIFLVLNLKIRNDSNKIINVNTRDYIRLAVDDNKADKIALEIHNDPVSVQPISTKSTRLGLPIKEADKKLMLYVGEIEGKKISIPVNFKN